MTRVTVVPAGTTVPALVPWLRTVAARAAVAVADGGTVVVVLVLVGPAVLVVAGRVVVVVVRRVVVVVGPPAEKQAQASPARCSRCTAPAKVCPVTGGTVVPAGKQSDQVMPTRAPFGKTVPGTNGCAPTVTLGGLPGTESDATTLWLGKVCLLQGAFRGTVAKPAVLR